MVPIVNTTLFDRFAPILRGASEPAVRDKRLLMDEDDGIEIFYAPFEYINPRAKIVLVGITPGPTQMCNSNRAARRALMNGASHVDAMRAGKETGAFSGEPMRSNLVRQLDHWGFPEWLGIRSASELFGSARDLAQSTSLLRYPVFRNGEDYRGAPDMTSPRNRLLRRYLMEHFVQEVNELREALFLGLGPAVEKVLSALTDERVIDGDRVIRGLLHPSGNNTYRIAYLVGDRLGPTPHATTPEPYDRGRADFRRRFLKK